MEVGDTFTLSLKGINEFYPHIPNYLAGGSANREDYSTGAQYGIYRAMTAHVGPDQSYIDALKLKGWILSLTLGDGDIVHFLFDHADICRTDDLTG